MHTETRSVETRISILEEQMDRLFGVNGRQGIIDKIQGDIAEVKELALKARYVVLGCVVTIVVFQVLTGTGTVSLAAILKSVAH